MAILVTDPSRGSQVPFLRGILTRSLTEAGLSFDEAYEVANAIRNELGSDSEITTDKLAKLVIKHLRRNFDAEVVERYERGGQPVSPIIVVDREGMPHPFSKGRVTQHLRTTSLPASVCHGLAADLELSLVKDGVSKISSTELVLRTYDFIKEHQSEHAARKYLVWVEFSRSGRPLILLVGGTTGSGKSTVSAEVAHLLNIVRAQSTDMLREVMRLMIPKRLIPSLHTSSYLAWETLPEINGKKSDDSRFVSGYLAQSEHVGVGIEGVLLRADREQVSMIIEGVHVHPALQNQLRNESGTLVVPVIIAVLKEKQLRKRLKGRGLQVSSRRSARYLENFDAIWRLQSFLLSEADRFDIPIIVNDEIESAVTNVMTTIVDYLSTVFTGDPANISE